VDNDPVGVVDAQLASCRAQLSGGRLPWLIDVLCRQLGQLRQPLAHVVAVLVVLLGEGDGRVAAEVLVEEARAREPHPVAVVEGRIGVQ